WDWSCPEDRGDAPISAPCPLVRLPHLSGGARGGLRYSSRRCPRRDARSQQDDAGRPGGGSLGNGVRRRPLPPQVSLVWRRHRQAIATEPSPASKRQERLRPPLY